MLSQISDKKRKISVFLLVSILFMTIIIGIGVADTGGDAGEWTCPACGTTGNSRNFCRKCGKPRPVGDPSAATNDKAEKAEKNIAETANVVAEAEVNETAGETKVMTHAEFIAAELDSEVVIESYVQAHQSWWDNKVTVYLQSEDGAYFAYQMACSEEDAAKLVPGQKIRVKGYKTEWAGEVEIGDGCTFEFVEAEPWIATAADVTALLATPELADHMNEFVAVKGATVVAQNNGEGFAYKNPEEKTDDLYFAVKVDDMTYNFCVEYYLCGKDTPVYKAVEGLKVGDVVDIEGFLYWYNGPNLQATAVWVK